jgi:nucleotidyltransferase/DNA polymerase involved in DNA repair
MATQIRVAKMEKPLASEFAYTATPRTRKIIHCDCDCFYAAIEMRDDPSLRDKPLAVGGLAGQRGVVATCNYGIDEREVQTSRERKSASVEETYVNDLRNLDACIAEVPKLLDQLLQRIERANANQYIYKLYIKIKFTDFRHTSVECTAFKPDLSTYLQLIETGFSRRNLSVRLIGLGVRVQERRVIAQLPLFHT